MKCEATYTVKGEAREPLTIACQRTAKQYPHDIHRWSREMKDGGLMVIEWRAA